MRVNSLINYVTIGSDDGLLPVQPQAIVWTKS